MTIFSFEDPGAVEGILRLIGERARERAEEALLAEAKRIDALEQPKASD